MRKLLSVTLALVLVCLSAWPVAASTAYTVRPGDTLYNIALRFGVSVSDITNANGITNPDLIFVGQVLVIPGGSTGSTTTGGTSSGKCGSVYTVQHGDTLNLIANKCGSSVSAIANANQLANPNLIFAGQRLTIPSGSSLPSPTPAPAPAPAPAPTPAPAPQPSSHGLTATLTLCNPEKPSFAATLERICFRELVVNNTDGPVGYSILGVQATNAATGATQFQTSWQGDLAVPARGTGPADGGWEDGIYISVPGTYRLQLAVCFATPDTCYLGTGWEVLTSGVNVNVVVWTP